MTFFVFEIEFGFVIFQICMLFYFFEITFYLFDYTLGMCRCQFMVFKTLNIFAFIMIPHCWGHYRYK